MGASRGNASQNRDRVLHAFLIPKSFTPDNEITNKIENSFKVYSQKRDHFIQVGFYYTKSNAKGDITKKVK